MINKAKGGVKMPNSKDKHLDDLLAIQRLTPIVKHNPVDHLCGLGTRTLLSMVAPSLLRSLDKIGLGPGRRI